MLTVEKIFLPSVCTALGIETPPESYSIQTATPTASPQPHPLRQMLKWSSSQWLDDTYQSDLEATEKSYNRLLWIIITVCEFLCRHDHNCWWVWYAWLDPLPKWLCWSEAGLQSTNLVRMILQCTTRLRTCTWAAGCSSISTVYAHWCWRVRSEVHGEACRWGER